MPSLNKAIVQVAVRAAIIGSFHPSEGAAFRLGREHRTTCGTTCQACAELLAADQEVSETIKFNRPYSELQGNIFALLAAKNHVNVFLYDGAIVPDPENIITGGHDNKTARTVAIHEDETINETVLTAMFKQIIANNRAGCWRKLPAVPRRPQGHYLCG